MSVNRMALFGIAVLCISSISRGQATPPPFDTDQKQSCQRLIDTVTQLIAAETKATAPELQHVKVEKGILSTMTLAACAGDPSLTVQQMKDPISSDSYVMNAYFLAADTKLRLGENQPGAALLAQGMDKAKLVWHAGHTNGGNYAVAGAILARMGAIKEFEQLYEVIPKTGPTRGQTGAEYRYLVAQDLLVDNKPDEALKMADQIVSGPFTGASRYNAFQSIGNFFRQHNQSHRAAEAYTSALLTVSDHPFFPGEINGDLDVIAKMGEWQQISLLMESIKPADPNALRMHVAWLLADHDVDVAAKLAATVTTGPTTLPLPNADVDTWLKIAAAYYAKGNSAKCDDAIVHARNTAQDLGKTDPDTFWPDAVHAFINSIIEELRVAKTQDTFGDAKGAAATLDDVSKIVHVGMPPPSAAQIAQAAALNVGTGAPRDETLRYLASGFAKHGDNTTAEQTVAEIKFAFLHQLAAKEIAIIKAGSPLRPAASLPPTLGRQQDMTTTNAIITLLRDKDDIAGATEKLKDFYAANARLAAADLIALAAAQEGDSENISKAIAAMQNPSQNEVAFVGVICGGNGDAETAKAILKKAQTGSPNGFLWRSGELRHGDRPFHETMLLLRARLADTQVVADVAQKVSSTAKRLPGEVQYYEWAMIQAIAGATEKDMEWISSLPPSDQLLALHGAAEGYLERMSHCPAEQRRYDYRQRGYN